MHNQTWIHHNSLNIHPFSTKFILALSVEHALQVYDKKTEKKESRNPTFLESSMRKPWIQVLKSSRSNPEMMIWSLMQEISAESTWMELNLQDPSSWVCARSAWFLAKSFKPEINSYSMMPCEHDYAIIFRCCVKIFQVSIERIFGGKWDFEI